MRLRNVLVVLATAALSSVAAGQTPVDPPQVFRGATTLIPLDVRVIDRQGKPVTDLTQGDFVVTESGVRQTIRHFSTQSYTPEAPTPAEALRVRTEKTDSIDPQNRRVFLIVLGRGRLQPPAKGVDGAIHFVRERLLPQDLVSVIAWNRATEFSADHAQVADLLERFKKSHESIEAKLKISMGGLAAVYGSKGIPPALQKDIDGVFGTPAAGLGVRSTEPSEGPNTNRLRTDRDRVIGDIRDATRTDPAGSSDLNLDEFVQNHTQSMQDLGLLYAGIDYLRHFDGEKQLIFVSESGLVLPRSEDDKDLAAVAADARVVINFIHTGGVQMGSVSMAAGGYSASQKGLAAPPMSGRQAMASMTWQRQTAGQVSSITGGRASIGRYAKDALDDIDQNSRFQYVLGYYPSNTRQDSRFRQIRVTVNRPGVVVLYRHGYYANPPTTPLDRQHMLTYSRVVAAASYPSAVPDIGIRATATGSKPPAAAAIQIEVTLDPARLVFAQANGRNTSELELLVGCLDGGDHILSQIWKQIQLNFTDERLAVVKQSGVPISLPLPINVPVAAAKSVKVVVYDYAADLVGSAIIKIQ